MEITLATAANSRYLGHIRPYLESLSRLTGVRVHLVCVGCKPPDYLAEMPHITPAELSREDNEGAPPETESPQHGAWLRAVAGAPDDVCIFTDGDMIVQRDFTQAERARLMDLPPGVILATYNSGPTETLAVEGARLFPRMGHYERINAWPGYIERPCYNIGVLVGRRATLQALYYEYMPHWVRACETFGHAARQQWLVCWTAAKMGLRVDIQPYSFHANGHYGIPPGVNYRNGSLYAGDEMVLFRHKL